MLTNAAGDTDLSVPPPEAEPAAAVRGRFSRVGGGWLATRVLPPLVLFALAVGIWELVSYVILDPSRRFLLPPLQTVVNETFLNHANFISLLKAFGTTAQLAMIGLAIAIAAGVLIAVLMSQAKVLERGLYPYLIILQTVPVLALVPLIGFWFGFGSTSRIVVCVIISLFPIVANTSFGLQAATAPQHDLFSLHQAGRVRRLRSLTLPAALPAMFAGFRISAGLSVVGEIVGGFFFQRGPTDLGITINTYVDQLNGPLLFGAIIFCCALGVAVFWVFSGLTRVVCGAWKE